MEVEGWEGLLPPPALLIGIHFGALFVWDSWTVGMQWWRCFGDDRRLHGTAHDALMAVLGIGVFFARWACCPRVRARSRARSRPGARRGVAGR